MMKGYGKMAIRSKQIEPLTKDYSRMPEQGRIRFGVKTDRAMKFIETFRFTSPDKEAITDIADYYGGEVKRWFDEKATPKSQWEVITLVNELTVLLPPNSIDVSYEEWSGGGLVRRCDGVTAEAERETPDGIGIDAFPCHCSEVIGKGGSMLCNPVTRLNVILPDVRFGGTWRVQSNGWNASKELPAMAELISDMQNVGLIDAILTLEKRKSVKHGKTKNFVVPKLTMNASPVQIMSGDANPKIEKAKVIELDNPMTPQEIVDAEVIEEKNSEGWDKPPEGVAVKVNPNPPPKYIPAHG